jgi:hypothetical protein
MPRRKAMPSTGVRAIELKQLNMGFYAEDMQPAKKRL